MGLRERVRRAIAGPVEESERLLSDLENADAETKLSILVSGWGRGLSAALEELAVAIEGLRGRTEPRPPVAQPPAAESREAPPEPAEAVDLSDADEAQLIDEATKSREKTAEAREEAEEVRKQLDE